MDMDKGVGLLWGWGWGKSWVEGEQRGKTGATTTA